MFDHYSERKISFSKYFQTTVGLPPHRTSPDELAHFLSDAKEACGKIGLKWESGCYERYDELTKYSDVSQFGDNLRRYSGIWVDRVLKRVGLTVIPQFKIEVTSVDEYWSNWIDGKLGEDVLLRINTHPRIKFRRQQDESLAAHEIAGHALQVLSLNAEREAGRLEDSLMNTTVHGPESFQMEGLAQTVLALVAEDGEEDDFINMYDTVGHYHAALTNNAQLDIEDGKSIDQTIRDVLAVSPLMMPVALASDLRDRSHNPMLRGYVHVYHPSMIEFLRVKKLDASKRISFLRDMYTTFWTPMQIRAKIDVLERLA